ncbi:MAG: methyltransferase domain-containing protein [Cyclobacteriaceae bacterium]
MPKDLFSKQAATYAKYRPTYPDRLYDFIYSYCDHFDLAWDCATGNGQVASVLAKRFQKVIATDISEKQLCEATPHTSIEYARGQAEKTHFPDATFDLITVAQAIHWFDHNSFFKEMDRVLKPGGILAFWGYGLIRFNNPIDQVIDHFYQEIIGPYWDNERKHIELSYRSIETPFQEIDCPPFAITSTHTFSRLIGYLSSWSSVQKFKEANQSNPIELIETELRQAWGTQATYAATQPIFMRICAKSHY